jgi:uncharacterized Tic20 family protein
LGFLAPLCYWLAKKGEDAAVDEECRKVLNFQVIYSTLSLMVAGVLMAIPIETVVHWGLNTELAVIRGLYFVGLLNFGLSLVAAYRISKGNNFKYPISVNVVRKIAK